MSKKNILVICPHLPHLDPRIDWIAGELEKKYEVNVIGSFPERKDLNINEEAFYKNHTTRLISIKQPFLSIDKTYSLIKKLKIIFNILLHNIEIFINKNVSKRKYRGLTKIGFIWYFCAYFYRSFKALWNGINTFYFKPDVIYCNDLGSLLPGIFCKKKYGSLLIYDAHEIYWDSVNGSPKSFKILVRWYENILMRFVDIFITVSPPILNLYLQNYPYLKGRAFSVPNAAKYENLLENKKLDKKQVAEKKKIIFLYQGVIDRDRGIEELLQAWREENVQNAELIIRGPSTYEADVLEKMAGPLLNKTVFFPQPVDHDDLISAAQFADIGIISYPPYVSLNQKYCSPNKFGQYMQAGLAIMSSNTEFIGSKVKEYKNGLVYDPRNIDDIRKVIRNFVSDKRLLNECKKHSLHYARYSFNWELVSQEVFKELDSKLKVVS